MTPRILNNYIKQGRFFYIPDPSSPPGAFQELIVRQAKTVKAGDQRLVKVRTDAGWLFAASVRPAGQQEAVVLDGEGSLTWYMNA